MSTPAEDRREKLEATCSDIASKLLYYDRKEDEELPVGTIEEMILNGETTLEEILEWVNAPLRAHLSKREKKS